MVTVVKRSMLRVSGFAQRQTHNFKLMLIRRTLHAGASTLSEQYNPIYATALGADPVQLGSLQSVGNAVGALVSLPAGWLIDHYSLKKVFTAGTLFLGASAALYFVAPHWTYLYAAIILFYVGNRVVCTCCTVTCATGLKNEDRATGRGLCRTLSAVTGLIAPMAGALIISVSGGMTAAGLRPLYAVQFALFAAMLILLLAWFRESTIIRSSQNRRHFFTDFTEVFKQGPDVVRLIIIISMMALPWSMTQPFMPLFAHQFKGADEFILGGFAVAVSIPALILAIPLGRLADRYGRKNLLFALAPLCYAANLFLIFATGPSMVLAAGFFFGFNSISVGIASAMTAEMMPKAQMGRWIGTINLVKGLIAIPAPLIGGLLWERVAPEYVFVFAIVIDVLIRLPLLFLVRETLHLTVDSGESAG